MDIHHAMAVRTDIERVYEALTQPGDLSIWMDSAVDGTSEVGADIEFIYDQGKRTLKMQITRLEAPNLVQWRVTHSFWPSRDVEQVVTWTLSTPWESGVLVDFRMTGWTADDDLYASSSYKWACFIFRLKLYLGDRREIASLLPILSIP
jgi:uncharacterized protein YndB with AHSA1/START domain